MADWTKVSNFFLPVKPTVHHNVANEQITAKKVASLYVWYPSIFQLPVRDTVNVHHASVWDVWKKQRYQFMYIIWFDENRFKWIKVFWILVSEPKTSYIKFLHFKSTFKAAVVHA